jgi:hypothetical protein
MLHVRNDTTGQFRLPPLMMSSHSCQKGIYLTNTNAVLWIQQLGSIHTKYLFSWINSRPTHCCLLTDCVCAHIYGFE